MGLGIYLFLRKFSSCVAKRS